jgi:hypothetical protein
MAAAPPGWLIAGSAPADYEFAVDATTAASGKQSATITAKPGARSGGFGTLMQTIGAENYRGGRWRLSAYLRTDAANRAQMWMRVDGPDQHVLGFDNMDSHPVTGTTAWTRYDIVLDVPTDAVDVAFGFLLISSGKVWGDGFKLEKVDTTVPVSFAGPTLPRVPANPDFEDGNSSQTAVWTRRELHFAPPPGDVPLGCARIHDQLKFVLEQLGARKSDLRLDTRSCYMREWWLAVDATFYVLTPVDAVSKSTAEPSIEAHWQPVRLRAGNDIDECRLLQYVRREVLPLFSTRNAKVISIADCEKTHIGVSADVLNPGRE